VEFVDKNKCSSETDANACNDRLVNDNASMLKCTTLAAMSLALQTFLNLNGNGIVESLLVKLSYIVSYYRYGE